MGFPRQEYWSGFPFPSPRELPDPRVKLGLLLGRQILYHRATWEAPYYKIPLFKYAVCACWVTSVMSDSVTLRTVTHQAPLSMGFFRQEHWSGLPCPPLGDLLNPGIEPTSFMSPALTSGFFTTRDTWEAHLVHYYTPKLHFDLHGFHSEAVITYPYFTAK